jgi:seryl-tRNA synthetase
LHDPQRIAAELERRNREHDAGQVDAHRELQVIAKALAALDREAQRWDTAYAQEVSELAELQVKKHDIAERRQQFMAQHAEVQQELQQAQDEAETVRDLFRYCQQVQARLTTLDLASQHLALEALDIRVTWTPGSPVQIEGRVPLDITASPAIRCR